jgi:hypothetical protein
MRRLHSESTDNLRLRKKFPVPQGATASFSELGYGNIK